ncbi:MAG: beta-galactosidase [Mariniflexile sp.]|jgi:beta-galactosidase
MKNQNQFIFFKCLLCFFAVAVAFSQNIQKASLNGQWSFRIDPYSEGETSGWSDENLDTSSWTNMKVPGNWDLVNEYAEYAGDAWYSRTFKLDKQSDVQQVRLLFQSVYNDSKVWVNGQLVGENHFGFLPFHFDISKYIKYGQENRLTVLVNNVFKRGAMWNWGGIRRPVWLEITPLTRLEYQHIDAVPNLEKGDANIALQIICSNSSPISKNIALNIKIKRDNRIVAEGLVQTTIPPNTVQHKINWSYNLSKPQVALWHYDFPNLYESTITLSDNNGMVHTISDRFGIRKLEIDGIKLLLNGESIRPVGFNMVPEDRFTGNTLPFERIKEDVDLMKSLGVNMARLSHVSLPKEYLDYLDEKGIMIFEEVGLWGKDAWVDPEHPMPKAWLQRIIEEKYNHPSVVGWSVGNEIGKVSDNPKVKEYVKGAIEMAKDLNPNRLAVYASHTAQKFENDAVIYADIAMINMYGGWGTGADRTWEYHKKPIFVSEFGNTLNSEDPNLGSIPIEKMMNSMRNKNYVLGASLWTFNDYRSAYHGTSGWKTPPSQNRAWGVVTSFRERKRAFYDLQKEFAPIKSLTISEVDKNNGKATVTIQPRNKLDIPANVLREFSVRWRVMDTDFNALDMGLKKVKLINPGDEDFTIPINWTNKRTVNGLKVEFLDPQGYTVLEAVKYFAVPNKPTIKFSNTSNNAVRILFDKLKGASEYMLTYYKGDSIYYSEKTINDFIEIQDENIKQGEPWTYQLIALNNAGESKPSEAMTLMMDEDELPPVIWGTKRTDNGVFIAYTVSPYDYLYEVEYGSKSGIYDKNIATKVKGVLNIPNIKKEEPLFFRMRTIKQWGFPSEWTQEFKVDY